MDWINQVESRKFLIVSSVLLVAFSALIITYWHSPFGRDSFWHLQMGKDWLENGLSPWIDHYSFTFNGQAITNPPVIFQGLLHLSVSQFGMKAGYLVFRVGCSILTIGLSFLLLKQMKAPAFLYAIVIPMIVFLLQLRVLVRPELLSYSFSVIALMLYFRAGHKISARNVVPMIMLMWVWSNYHSSVVGYVIFFGFFFDCAIAQLNTRASVDVWVKWLFWGLLIFAVGFLNHDFSHPMLQAITFPSEWKILINEYLPPAPIYKSIAGIYVLVLFSVLTPVLALRQRQFGLLLVWAVLAISGITMNRMVTPSGIVIVLIAVYLIINSNLPSRLNLAGDKTCSNVARLVVLVSIAAILYSNVERTWFFVQGNRSVIGRYPVSMADYMVNRNLTGRIFNTYSVGGYLIYRLALQNQVYIDGRTQILYPPEHMVRHARLMNPEFPEILRAEMDKYSVDQIIWRHSQSSHDLIQAIGGFGLDFLDATYVLYTRSAPNFPLLGKLMSFPECWQPDMKHDLQEERQKMDEVLPAYSGLFPFADLVVGYSNADDGKAFLDANIDGNRWFDEMRRFAGFRLFESGHYDLVVNLLGGVEIQKPKDYLASALAMLKARDPEIAAQIIAEFSSVQWPYLGTDDVFINYKLYQALETQRELTPVEQQRVETLKLRLLELGHPDIESGQALNIESFCRFTKNWQEKYIPIYSNKSGT